MHDISIHAPHTGRDTTCCVNRPTITLFQSTRPIRGATLHDNSCCFLAGYFNPRAPYGARQGIDRLGDPTSTFQSTRPIRGATADTWRQLHDLHISIHAPHTGRDARHGLTAEITITFQSTRPIRGATPAAHASATNRADFNPRAPYGARRLHPCIGAGDGNYFNPRAPYGARRTAEGGKLYKITFQSTRPIRGATWPTRPYAPHSTAFQSTRPIRGATIVDLLGIYSYSSFQSTRPIRGATSMVSPP